MFRGRATLHSGPFYCIIPAQAWPHATVEEVSMRVSWILGIFAVLLASNAFAQSARITGRVTDITGAVIPGTSITVTNAGTAAVRRVTTNEEGYYTVPSLLPGEYRISIEHAG